MIQTMDPVVLKANTMGCVAAAREKAPLQFRALQPEDKSWADPILRAEDSLSSVGCFGTLYLWGPIYGQTTARLGERILNRFDQEGRVSFAYPMGSGPLLPAIRVMEDLAAAEGQPLVLRGLTAGQRQRLEQELPGRFTFREDRDVADYIYEVEKLATLSGKKLQAKRNHCNRFERENPGWRFEPLEARHFADCLALLDRWAEERRGERDEGEMDGERRAIEAAFLHYGELELLGGCLFARDRLVAFTLGEKCGGESVDVRFEKADPNLEGAFAMINREFARLVAATCPEVKYLNREEDLGIEALRKAKLSYRPAFLAEKFTACDAKAPGAC